MSRSGMTLLETLVALLILSLVGVGFLEVFGNATRSAQKAEEWSRAVFLAEEAVERAKLGDMVPGIENLPPFVRETRVEPWRDGLVVIAVEVSLPGGGQLDLRRLAEVP